jgi:hypothetical protein
MPACKRTFHFLRSFTLRDVCQYLLTKCFVQAVPNWNIKNVTFNANDILSIDIPHVILALALNFQTTPTYARK